MDFFLPLSQCFTFKYLFHLDFTLVLEWEVQMHMYSFIYHMAGELYQPYV